MIPEVVLLAILIIQVMTLFMMVCLDMEGMAEVEAPMKEPPNGGAPGGDGCDPPNGSEDGGHLIMIVILWMKMIPLIMRNFHMMKMMDSS